MSQFESYFSDCFDINPNIIEQYGAINISMINDLPLFIDPFLLFNSEKDEYQEIHKKMIAYLKFLRDQSNLCNKLPNGMLNAWYLFSEVKQTWLGFSLEGNIGRGLGRAFAEGLHNGLNSIFKSFGEETITMAPHMEKLCLISPNVGRDKISDFTTNFAKEFLLRYTQNFAENYLKSSQCRTIAVPKVFFNYKTRSWATKTYYLPWYNNDYVILTPKDMLTRENTFINRSDMINNLVQIAPSVSDETLRFQLNNYLCGRLWDKYKEPTKAEKRKAAEALIRRFPQLIDYYMKYKEEHKEEATSISKQDVHNVETLFINQAEQIAQQLSCNSCFYKIIPNAYDEAMKRVQYLKHFIEDQDGYRFFYVDGKAIKREFDLQLLFRLVWFASPFDVNREVNNGRGPVDYKISYGKDNSALVEFKLASNSKLKKNLANQVEIYKAASETQQAIKVIMFFSDSEENKLINILKELGLFGNPDIVLIDARNNKISASNV